MKKLFFILFLIVGVLVAYLINSHSNNLSNLKIMKDVGEAYMDNFGLIDADFAKLENAGINTIEGNFDICANDEDVKYFLDSSQKHNIKVIMPAGSGEAEWSYKCDQEKFPDDQKPVWNKKGTVDFVKKWKNHPAVIAWDISNEAGSVFPNYSKNYYLTADQLKVAYKDIKRADPTHPIMIRMNGWFFYDYESDFFRVGNPFDKNVADIVMINAYSNVDDYYDDFVTTVTERSRDSIKKIDHDTKIVIALGAWEEQPLWDLPSEDEFQNDIDSTLDEPGVSGIAFFKYGAKGSEWYMPDAKIGAPNLLKIISSVQF